jgi:Ca-activated chloride channel family protein
VTSIDERRFSVRLAGHTIPNKDFVLRYKVAEAELSAAAWSSASEGGAAVLITALPPRLTEEFEPSPREFVFVIDRSGSMTGGPILQARNALRACLRSLGEQDSFNILGFDHQIEWMSESACGVTQPEIERADRWLEKIDARGGTEILEAIDAALKLSADRERQRYIVFLTDGAVSADEEAMRRVERGIGSARLFTFGIGPSVNRALLARMAELGRGTVEFLQLNEDIEEAIIRFQDRVAYPVLQDLTLEWEGVTSWDVYPARLPDLYIGQPLEIVARVRPTGDGPSRLHIKGRRGSETVELSVDLPAAASADPVILRAWARARIDDLLDRLRNDLRRTAELRAEIIGLSIAYNLLTPFTAFVAVDSEESKTTDRRRVSISTPLPEGLDMEGFFGGPDLIASSMLAQPPAAPMMLDALFDAGESMSASYDSSVPEMREAPTGGLSKFISSAQKLLGRDRAEERLNDFEIEMSQDPLRWLARTQNVSGSWGAGDDEVEMTAAAVLAFARAGHTHRAGHYRRQMAKAIKWLLKARAKRCAAQARAQALLEVAEASGDSGLLREARSAQSGLPPFVAPSTSTYTSLDDLRAAAVLREAGEVAPALLKSAKGELARVWMILDRINRI